MPIVLPKSTTLLLDNKWTQSINNTHVTISLTIRQTNNIIQSSKLNTVKHCTCNAPEAKHLRTKNPLSKSNAGLTRLTHTHSCDTGIDYYHNFTHIRYVTEVCLNSTIVDKNDSTLSSLHNDNTQNYKLQQSRMPAMFVCSISAKDRPKFGFAFGVKDYNWTVLASLIFGQILIYDIEQRFGFSQKNFVVSV